MIGHRTKIENMLENTDMYTDTSSSDESSTRSVVNNKGELILDRVHSSVRRAAVKPHPVKKNPDMKCHICLKGFYNDEYVEYMFCINCKIATCIRCNSTDIRCDFCNKNQNKIRNTNDINYIQIKSNKRYCFWFC
jgi:hypothetical protein